MAKDAQDGWTKGPAATAGGEPLDEAPARDDPRPSICMAVDDVVAAP